MMDAVVLAGGQLTPDNPLFDLAPAGHRSLIDIHGKPMVQWVIDAISSSDHVGTIYIAGLTPEAGLTASKSLIFLPDGGGMFENIRLGTLRAVADHPDQSKVLIASADIPAVTVEMVDWLASQVSRNPDYLLYYNVVPREVMESRFPSAARSYVHFKDVAVCGGDLNVIDKELFTVERPVWKKLTEARKSPLRQAGLLGLDTLVLIALRCVTLQKAVKRVCRRLSLTGKALICPYAEMAMDADKPHQLAILREDLEGAR